MIPEVSARYRVDPALVRAVVETESNWNPSAISSRGAQGLMQLVPTTAQQMGVNNVLDPKQNLDGGVHYLQLLLQRYNGDLDKALAAYNAGPGAVDRARGVPRYTETRAYVPEGYEFVLPARIGPHGSTRLILQPPIYQSSRRQTAGWYSRTNEAYCAAHRRYNPNPGARYSFLYE